MIEKLEEYIKNEIITNLMYDEETANKILEKIKEIKGE